MLWDLEAVLQDSGINTAVVKFGVPKTSIQDKISESFRKNGSVTRTLKDMASG